MAIDAKLCPVPQADMTQTINNNINLLHDQQRELQDSELKGDALKAKLDLEKIVYEIKQLDRPRTVCSDAACVSFSDEKKHYKQICHNPCYFKGVEVDKIQCETILQCAAFNDGKVQNCTKCKHRWQAHLHILWEPVEKKVKVQDHAVLQRLKENANKADIVRTAILSREKEIAQYQTERAFIQNVAGKFSVYLKRTSIKPYNDSKLEYLDHLIDEEKGKVQAGGRRNRLDSLISDRSQHVEEVETLMAHLKQNENEEEEIILGQGRIDELVKELFSLKLMGPDLKRAARKLQEIEKSLREEVKTIPPQIIRPSSHERKSISLPGFSMLERLIRG